MAIFVDSLLNFWSASAVLPSHETIPFKELVRSNAAFMTNVSDVTCGFCDILVFEEHCVTDSCCPGFHNVDVETSVMLHRCPDVETGVCVNVPGSSVLGFDVGHYRAS
jgi:hypothetical protein